MKKLITEWREYISEEKKKAIPIGNNEFYLTEPIRGAKLVWVSVKDIYAKMDFMEKEQWEAMFFNPADREVESVKGVKSVEEAFSKLGYKVTAPPDNPEELKRKGEEETEISTRKQPAGEYRKDMKDPDFKY